MSLDTISFIAKLVNSKTSGRSAMHHFRQSRDLPVSVSKTPENNKMRCPGAGGFKLS